MLVRYSVHVCAHCTGIHMLVVWYDLIAGESLFCTSLVYVQVVDYFRYQLSTTTISLPILAGLPHMVLRETSMLPLNGIKPA